MEDAFAELLRQALSPAYTVVRELTGGGMSRVFLAHEQALGRSVVVKALKPELAAGVNRDRFRREMLLAAQLQHPHIVPVLTAGQHGELLWYTMPFVEGESLRESIQRKGAFTVRETTRVLHDILDALAYAHRNGVVHRDIKPGNILRHGAHSLVADFGVAKAISAETPHSGTTSVGVAIGTPAYMAPEQIAADPGADHRMDLYAVGLLAYELLTGAQPFNEPSPQETMAAQLSRMPAPLEKVRPDTPPELAALIMDLLAKRPGDRPARAEVALERLEAFSGLSTDPSRSLASTIRTPGGAMPGYATPVPATPSGGRRRVLVGAGVLALGLIAFLLVRQGGGSDPGSTAVTSVAGDSAPAAVSNAGISRDDSLAIAAAVQSQMAKERQAEAATPGPGRNLDSLQRALLRAMVDSAMRDAKLVTPRSTGTGRAAAPPRVGAATSRTTSAMGTARRVALLPVRDATARAALAPLARTVEDSLRRALTEAGFVLADDATLVRLLARQDGGSQRAIADSAGVGAIVTTILTARVDEVFAQAIVHDVWRNRPSSERQGADAQQPDGVLAIVGDVQRILDRVSWRSRSDPKRILVFDFDNQTGIDTLTPQIRSTADSIRAALARQSDARIVPDSQARATLGTEERRAVGNRLGVGAMVAGSVVRARSDSVTFRLSVRDMSEERTMPQFEIRVPTGAMLASVGAMVERLMADVAKVNWGPKAGS